MAHLFTRAKGLLNPARENNPKACAGLGNNCACSPGTPDLRSIHRVVKVQVITSKSTHTHYYSCTVNRSWVSIQSWVFGHRVKKSFKNQNPKQEAGQTNQAENNKPNGTKKLRTSTTKKKVLYCSSEGKTRRLSPPLQYWHTGAGGEGQTVAKRAQHPDPFFLPS